MFCVVKGHLLHIKRACFAMQKGVFYIAKGHVLFCSYESFLQKRVARGGARTFLWVCFWLVMDIPLAAVEVFKSGLFVKWWGYMTA